MRKFNFVSVRSDPMFTFLSENAYTLNPMPFLILETPTEKPKSPKKAVLFDIGPAQFEPEFKNVIQDLSMEITDGGDIILEAEVAGCPKPDVEWYRNDTLIMSSHHYLPQSRDDVYWLTIVGASPSDAGEYKCVASNPLGTRIRTYAVNIERKNNNNESSCSRDDGSYLPQEYLHLVGK